MAAKFFLCFTVLLIVCDCAPKRSKKRDNLPHTVYDQQQTGDYNIQLHLKDFQIIALLGDDVGLGDYDYTYDYSDFTVKPSTQKPTEPSSISSSTLPPSTPKPPTKFTTSRPPSHPYTFVTSSTATPVVTELIKPEEKPGSSGKPADEPISTEKPVLVEIPSSTEKPVSVEKPVTAENPSPAEKPVSSSEKTASTKKVASSEPPIATEKNPINEKLDLENFPFLNLNSISNTSTTQKSSKLDDPSSPGKIKVQIIETPVRMNIVPGEDIEQNETLPQGDIFQLRRCATGFTRDKRGRCRRVRRPGNIQSKIPFGFSRLASSLASKFRQTSGESSISSSESKED